MIIPVHHIIVANVPVVATTTFEAGQALAVDVNGYAITAVADGDTADAQVIGLAADRNRAAEGLEFLNRVSDMGNDTGGSGQVAVYTGGIFYVDVDEGTDGNLTTPAGTIVRGVIAEGATTTPGTRLYASSSAGGYLVSTNPSTTNQVVATILEPANELSSGIPGEYEPGSSLKLTDDSAPRQWVKIKLSV